MTKYLQYMKIYDFFTKYAKYMAYMKYMTCGRPVISLRLPFLELNKLQFFLFA